MAATQLSLYNGALLILGERGLVSLAEKVEPRRTLDRVWDRDPVKACLEEGQWKFAIRRVRQTYNPSIQPDFGYRYAFDQPSDFVRIAAISADEYFNEPLVRYEPHGGYWFADVDTIFLKYVSDDNQYGRDYSLWPKTFERYVEAYMAFESMDRLTADDKKVSKVASILAKYQSSALSKDAMAGPPKKFPTGSWVASRHYGRGRE